MATIRQRGKRWQAVVRLRGAEPVSASFATKTAALRWAQNVESGIRDGRLLGAVAASRVRFGELVERYLAGPLHQLAPSVQRNRRGELAWWLEQLGNCRANEITPDRIAAARDRLTCSGPTTNRYLAALSSVLTYAVREWMVLPSNPVSRVRRRPESAGRMRILSEKERHALVQACRDCNRPNLKALVTVAVCTGMRRGEILGLRWEDIDRERGLARLRHTKNGTERTVPLAGPALEALSAQPRNLADTRVFWAMPCFPERAWQQVCRTAGLDDLRFHDLRHTAASYLAMTGASLAELADILGHRTLAMVKRYAHFTAEHRSEVVNRMVDRFLA